jgi:hypothetical protein
VRDHAQAWKRRTHSQNSDCSSLPTIQPTSCCFKFPPLWSPLRCHQWGKAWERWRDYWKSEEVAVSTKFKLTGRGQEEERCSCFSLVHCCWSWWRLCRKMRCYIHLGCLWVCYESYVIVSSKIIMLQNFLDNLCSIGGLVIVEGKFSAWISVVHYALHACCFSVLHMCTFDDSCKKASVM